MKRHVSGLTSKKEFFDYRKTNKTQNMRPFEICLLFTYSFLKVKRFTFTFIIFLLILRVFYKFSIVSNSGSTLKTGNENSGCVEQLPLQDFVVA